MKRKLITLMAAFAFLVPGWLANAQSGQRVLIQILTGDSVSLNQDMPENDLLGPGTKCYGNEREGYAGRLCYTPNRLTYYMGATTPNKFYYRSGAPNAQAGSPDRIWVTNPDANYLIFSTDRDGTNRLRLTRRNAAGVDVTYDQFVVFKSRYPNHHVKDYYKYGQDDVVLDPDQVVDGADFNNGEIEGFLAVNASSSLVSDSNLLIVVHNKAGNLELLTYKEYVLSLRPAGYAGAAATGDPGDTYRRFPTTAPYYPLYIKTQRISGRWAKPEDFADCKFIQFGDLKVYDSSVVQPKSAIPATAKAYSVFNVKQVDYVKNNKEGALGLPGTGSYYNETNNIITHHEVPGKPGFYGAQFDSYFGTARKVSTSGDPIDSVIPLFVLSAPETNDCKVVSVSRINDLVTQSHQDAGYANQLELRDYGTYRYFTTAGVYRDSVLPQPTAATAALTPGSVGYAAHRNYDTYTSLQKFAIWIDDDGQYTLYPAASYFWQYGEPKFPGQEGLIPAQDVNILPNAVLIYNDISVAVGKDGHYEANRADGLKIGWWNGRTEMTLPAYKPGPYAGITTVPNNIQHISDYRLIDFSYICKEERILKGNLRFQFLQVDPDTVGLYRAGGGTVGNRIWAAFETGSYQYHRNHVLSTYVDRTKDPLVPVADQRGDAKYLKIVPEEIQRTTDEYWRFPYDSVNMAAHWEIQLVPRAVTGSDTLYYYRFINMLGDTLKYLNNKSDTLPGSVARTVREPLVGSYLTENRLIPGADPNLVYGTPGYNYFGRPGHTNETWTTTTHWFPKSGEQPFGSAADLNDLWLVHQLKGQEAGKEFFYLSPAYYKYSLTIDINVGVKGWYSYYDGQNLPVPGGSIVSNSQYYAEPENLMQAAKNNSGSPIYYYQADVALEIPANELESFNNGDFTVCGGLKLMKKDIPYVPKYGPFYEYEPENEVINTNDLAYAKQDSLTAYTFLTGLYNLKEAERVDNELVLGFRTIHVHDPYYTTSDRSANAACLVPQGSREAALEFIPLDSVGRARTLGIRAFGTTGGDGTDTLYSETYKWYLVKSTTLGKYLTFDTVNIAASTNREKVGLVFDADRIENATPIRLYQPLVGDKKNTNFLLQFYMPVYKYRFNANGTPSVAVRTTFPNVESSILGATVRGGGEVCFVTLSNESNYLYGTRAYTGLTSGTRFTVKKPGPPLPCDCVGEFIPPDWMAHHHLLNLPLKNQIWVNGDPATAWIGNGAVIPASNNGKRAIIVNDEDGPKTTLRHTYVASIVKDTTTVGVHRLNNGLGILDLPYTYGGNIYHTYIGGFESAVNPGNFYLDVPLYYVQNEDGKYLSVVNEDDMSDPRATIADVNGVKLQWRDKYENVDSIYAWRNKMSPYGYAFGYDKRVLQLFAISGCREPQPDANKWFGEFVYLPLASYQYDYARRRFTPSSYVVSNRTQYRDSILFNKHLGDKDWLHDCPPGQDLRNNDITACWRVSQYMAVDKSVKELVVFNSFNYLTGGSLVPIQVKWSRMDYTKPECDSWLVKNVGDKTVFRTDRYYALQTMEREPSKYNYLEHWKPRYAADGYLTSFIPEVQNIYGRPVGKIFGSTAATANTKWCTDSLEILKDTINQVYLRGEYYFIREIKESDFSALGTRVADIKAVMDLETEESYISSYKAYEVIDVSGYSSGAYEPKYDTLVIACLTKHKLMFYDLREDAGFYLPKQLAILEAPFIDRNLTNVFMELVNGKYEYSTTEIKKDSVYQAYISKFESFDDRDIYLTVYPGPRRKLTHDPDHVIPYFSFAVTMKGKEYFMNVTETNPQDSIYWTALSQKDKETLLLDTLTRPDFLPNFKFCLPYQVDSLGKKLPDVPYGDSSYPRVYLQTWDTCQMHDPFLVIAGASTKYVTARRLSEALYVNNNNTLKWNIYTIDYRHIDPMKVTAWIFGGEKPIGETWVRIKDAVEGGIFGTDTGLLTNYHLAKLAGGEGVTFIDQSRDTIVNYGIINGIAAPNLVVEFEGDTIIGNTYKARIWYYRVSIDNLYLTDAEKDTGSQYLFSFNGTDHKYGYFRSRLADWSGYTKDEIYADRYFTQAFGFKYVDPSDTTLMKGQAFYVVANADYTQRNADGAIMAREDLYRYLADVNNRLVFIEHPENALVFQWGKRMTKLNGDDGYTSLQVIGQGGIYGVPGGIKFSNTTGKVDIYSIDGRLIKSAVLTGGEQMLTVPRGIAVVKTGSKAIKVVVQ